MHTIGGIKIPHTIPYHTTYVIQADTDFLVPTENLTSSFTCKLEHHELPEKYLVLLQWLMLHYPLELQFSKTQHTSAVIWHVIVT